MTHLKLVSSDGMPAPASDPEADQKRYRDAHAEAEKQHHYRAAEAERTYASEVLSANAERKTVIENAPTTRGNTEDGVTHLCGDDAAMEAAEAAYRKTVEAADKKRIRTIERSREVCGNEIQSAKTDLRNSPGWQGWWP